MEIKKICFKVSGDFFSNNGANPIDKHKLSEIIGKWSEFLNKNNNVKFFIVVGAGNFWRGREYVDIFLDDKSKADYVGMLMTVTNAVVLSQFLKKNKVKVKIFSSIKYDTHLVDEYSIENVEKAISNNQVIIFAGGTGKPFRTTDTAVAYYAQQLNIHKIYVLKNMVDGLYDKDPNLNENAKFIPEISYDNYIENKYTLMDLKAIKICKNNKIKIMIFNKNTLNNIENVFDKDTIRTTIL